MNQTIPQEIKIIGKESAAPKTSRTFSENMIKLRRPFMYNDNEVRGNLKTFAISLIRDATGVDQFNTPDLDAEVANKSSIKNGLESTTEIRKNDDDKYKTFETNRSKRLFIGDSTNELGISTISDYFTDYSGNCTNYFLGSDTSIENLSFSDPSKNSTFISQGDTNKNDISSRKTNETFVFADKCNNSELKQIEIKHDPEFITRTSFISTKSLQIANNNSVFKNFVKKEDNILNRSMFEENKKLKAKIIQMELFKQIEIKDKVMSQLLEWFQALEFPKLKHLCNSECKKDDEDVCKKIKGLENDNKLREQEVHYCSLRHIWSQNVDKQEKNFKVIKKKCTKAIESMGKNLEKIKRTKKKFSGEALKQYDNFYNDP